MLSSTTGSATDASVSGIIKSCVTAGQPSPNPLTYTTASRRIKLLPPYRPVAGSNIPALRSETAAMDSLDIIVERDVHNAPLLPDLHATWARYASIKITYVQLENQNATREEFFDERLNDLDTDRVCIVKNCCVRAAVVANKHCVFQVFSSFPCD